MSTNKEINGNLSNTDRVNIHLHYLDHFLRVEQNEELQSEKIIKFFIGLVTAISAIFTFFLQSPIYISDVKVEQHCILIIGLSLLFIFGVIVFARVIWSDRKIKKHQELWTISYEQIKKIEPSIQCYRDKLDTMDDYKFRYLFRAIKGTLPQVLLVIESLFFALIIFLLSKCFNYPEFSRYFLSCLAFCFMGVLLLWWYGHLKSDLDTKEHNETSSESDRDLKANIGN